MNMNDQIKLKWAEEVIHSLTGICFPSLAGMMQQ
jgi:hypothetical protein